MPTNLIICITMFSEYASARVAECRLRSALCAMREEGILIFSFFIFLNRFFPSVLHLLSFVECESRGT